MTPKQLTVGVAGHVDHGKTSLVKALTGMETDRLREEQERGLSIVPGYAWLESERGVIDFIDVPGHEDFIRMMIAGATGIDCLLLTVAANEGVRPQTREHLDIANLLGTGRGLAVITKSDLVSASAHITDQLRTLTAGTFMQGAGITDTAISDRDSIDNLRGLLVRQLRNPLQRKNAGLCYLPLDRVFTMAGFGVVATGTLRHGTLTTGQEVDILPQGQRAVIRQLQVHNRKQDSVWPGQRVAVNLRNPGRHQPDRGDVLVTPGYLQPTRLLDVELRLLHGGRAALKYGEMVRVLFGACEASARLRMLGGAQAEPGSTLLAQLEFARAVVAPVGERFIMCSMSPAKTLGGGRILDNAPVKHRKSDLRTVNRLSRLASADTHEVIRELLRFGGARGVEVNDLARFLNLAQDELARELGAVKCVFVDERRVMCGDAFNDLCEQALARLEEFHRDNPLRRGQPPEDLRARLQGAVDEQVFRFLLEHLEAKERVRSDGNLARIKDFDPLETLDPETKKIADDIAKTFAAGGLTPPEPDDVLRGDPQRKRLYRLLTETGELVPLLNRDLNRPLVFHRRCIDEMARKLQRACPDSAAFSVAEARKLLGASRKFVIPLLEHLDSLRVTVRIGDRRKLL